MFVEVYVGFAGFGRDGGGTTESEGIAGEVPEGVEGMAVHFVFGEGGYGGVGAEDESVDWWICFWCCCCRCWGGCITFARSNGGSMWMK